jgi:hypothetical protein
LKRTQPFTESSTGPVKISPSGKFSCAGDEGALLDRHLQVDVRAFEGHLVAALQPVHRLALAGILEAPEGHRVLVVEHAGAEDELAVIAQAHLGLLGHGLRRVGGQRPVQLAPGGALEEGLHQRGAGLAGACQPLRVDGAQLAGVVLGPQVQAGVEGLGDQLADRGDEVQLRLRGVLEEDLVQPGDGILNENVGAGLDGFFVDGQGQFLGDGVGADLH